MVRVQRNQQDFRKAHSSELRMLHKDGHIAMSQKAQRIRKFQEQVLENVDVLFETGELIQWAAYAALSCAKSLQSVKFLSPLQMSDFLWTTSMMVKVQRNQQDTW